MQGTYNAEAEDVSGHAVFAAVCDKVQRKIRLRAVNVDHLVTCDVRVFAGTVATAGRNSCQAEVRDLCLEVRSQQNVSTGQVNSTASYTILSTYYNCDFNYDYDYNNYYTYCLFTALYTVTVIRWAK